MITLGRALYTVAVDGSARANVPRTYRSSAVDKCRGQDAEHVRHRRSRIAQTLTVRLKYWMVGHDAPSRLLPQPVRTGAKLVRVCRREGAARQPF